MLRTRDLDRYGYYDDRAGYFDRGWPPPSLMEVRARWLRWLCLAVAAAGAWAFVSYVVSHNHDPGRGLAARGWLVLGLAVLLVVLLGVHRRRRGLRALVRALAEYAIVALLAVLLTLTATGVPLLPPSGQAVKQQATKQATAKQQAGRASEHAANAGNAGKQATHGCPAVWQVPAWVGCLWRQAQDAYKPKPKPGPARALSPAVPSTRRTL